MSTVGGLDEVDGFSHAPVQGVLVQRQRAAGWGQGEVGTGGGHGHQGRGAADRQGGGAGEGSGHVGPPHGAGLRARRFRAGCPREPLWFVHLQALQSDNVNSVQFIPFTMKDKSEVVVSKFTDIKGVMIYFSIITRFQTIY